MHAMSAVFSFLLLISFVSLHSFIVLVPIDSFTSFDHFVRFVCVVLAANATKAGLNATLASVTLLFASVLALMKMAANEVLFVLIVFFACFCSVFDADWFLCCFAWL